MRISEKTHELNFCAQLNALCGNRLYFTGLTQAQEAREGYDFATTVRGRILLFQMKASNRITATNGRRFIAPHQQMVALRRHANNFYKSVFYVLPMIGDTTDYTAYGYNTLQNSCVVDVARLPQRIPQPRRATGHHHIDVIPSYPNATANYQITIRSEPFTVPHTNIIDFAKSNFSGTDNILNKFTEDEFVQFTRVFTRKAFAVIVPPS